MQLMAGCIMSSKFPGCITGCMLLAAAAADS
eukprot:COSAG01_NODE_6782_length_3501_cov_2.333627_4_plen_31_part_00